MRSLPALLVLVLLALTAGACAPGTPDEDSWRVDAIRAVGDVAASVGTMQVALGNDGSLFTPYLRTVAVDAEQEAEKAADKLGSRQPPTPYLGRYWHVTGQLQAAETLLTRARIAVVRGDNGAYDALVRRLADTRVHLERTEDDLHALPDDRSEP